MTNCTLTTPIRKGTLLRRFSARWKGRCLRFHWIWTNWSIWVTSKRCQGITCTWRSTRKTLWRRWSSSARRRWLCCWTTSASNARYDSIGNVDMSSIKIVGSLSVHEGLIGSVQGCYFVLPFRKLCLKYLALFSKGYVSLFGALQFLLNCIHLFLVFPQRLSHFSVLFLQLPIYSLQYSIFLLRILTLPSQHRSLTFKFVQLQF